MLGNTRISAWWGADAWWEGGVADAQVSPIPRLFVKIRWHLAACHRARGFVIYSIKMVTGNSRFTRQIYSVRARVELERWCTARVMCARVCVRACRFFPGVCDQRVRAVTNRHCCYTNAHTAKTGRIYFAEKPTGDYELSPPYHSHTRTPQTYLY